MRGAFAAPASDETFHRCLLDLGKRERNATAYALHRNLLALRREDTVLARRPAKIDGATLGEHAWLLRLFAEGADRLLVVNLGRDLTLAPMPEPLLAPLD